MAEPTAGEEKASEAGHPFKTAGGMTGDEILSDPSRFLGYEIGPDGLSVQKWDRLDKSSLSALTGEVMSRQATINVGTIGHVAHGKSTVVKALSSVKTVRFKSELERNITIKLGYANAKIYQSVDPSVPRPQCYRSFGSETPDIYECQESDITALLEGRDPQKRLYQLRRHVSFVDCPGHDILMATMLNGAAVMDAALLLIAGNEPCPQPQTSEHLAAVEIMKLKHIIILQNKIDLVNNQAAAQQCSQIREFVRGTVADSSPIIPISAQLQYNIDVICEQLLKIPAPIRDFTASPELIVIRSFDVNKPGAEPHELQGGVAGGSVMKGVLKIGQEIEILPGIIKKGRDGSEVTYEPIQSKITTLLAEKNSLEYAVPGGLIGVGTNIDPTLTRADRLVGQVMGAIGQLPQVYNALEINFFLLRKLLGVKSVEDTGGAADSTGGGASTFDDGSASKSAKRKSKKRTKIAPLEKGEKLMINIASTTTGGTVVSTVKDLAKVTLTSPVCTYEGAKLALSRRVDRHWRLIGWGNVLTGTILRCRTSETAT